MTKRVLVVDKAFDYFQYAIFDVTNDFKEIGGYFTINTNTQANCLANIVESVFINNRCDEIYINGLGTGLSLVDNINSKYYNRIRIGTRSMQNISNAIYKLMDDIRIKNICINKDSLELYDFLCEICKEDSIYYAENGFLKLGKYLNSIARKQLHLILEYYIGCSSLNTVSELEYWKNN